MDAPFTCHVSIGSDIIHSLLSCDVAALGQASYARRFPRAVVSVSFLDTQKQIPEGGGYDFVHVDGNHSFEGCLHDLDLSARLGRGWVLIDDTDHVPDVGRAVRAFVAERGLTRLFFPSFRGDCLIRLPGGW